MYKRYNYSGRKLYGLHVYGITHFHSLCIFRLNSAYSPSSPFLQPIISCFIWHISILCIQDVVTVSGLVSSYKEDGFSIFQEVSLIKHF